MKHYILIYFYDDTNAYKLIIFLFWMYEGVASSQTLYERKSSNHDLADNERCRICLDESG